MPSRSTDSTLLDTEVDASDELVAAVEREDCMEIVTVSVAQDVHDQVQDSDNPFGDAAKSNAMAKHIYFEAEEEEEADSSSWASSFTLGDVDD